MTGAAHDVWSGKLDQIYASNIGLLALPLSFLAVLPVAPLLGAMNQPVPYHDAATLVAGSYILFLGAFLLHAVRKVAWELGVRRQLVLLQVLAVVLVLLPELEYGHLDDVLALTAVVYTVRWIARREHVAAAAALSVAISFKQWAFMLVPLVIAGAPARRRVRAAFAAGSLPAILAALSIGLDGSSAVKAFFSPLPSSQLTGHPGFDPNWLGAHSSEASRLAAAVIATAVGIACARITNPSRFLAAVAVILAIRPLTETVNYSYYWSPTLLFVVLSLLIAEGRFTIGTAGWSASALLWSLPRGLDSSPAGWWVCQLVLLGALSWKALRVLRRGATQTESKSPAGTGSDAMSPKSPETLSLA